MLFAGLTPVAAVEAKRLNVNVAGKMAQAERYARGLSMDVEWAAPGLPKAATSPGPMAQASTLRCRLPTHATAAPSPAKARGQRHLVS